MAASWAAECPVSVTTSMVGMALLRVKVSSWLEYVGIFRGFGLYENVILKSQIGICIQAMGILIAHCW